MGKKKKKNKLQLKQERIAGTEPFHLGNGIYGRYLKNKQGRLELAIIVDDDVSQNDFRQVWTKIDIARQKLLEHQGSNMKLIHLLSLNKFSLIIQENYSYAEVAMDTNYDCLVNLCRAVISLNNGDKKGMSEDILVTFMHLKALRMKDKEIFQWINLGLKEIQSGRAPWTLDQGPVDKQRVRDALRQFSRDIVNGKIIIKSTPPVEYVPVSEIANKPQNKNPRLMAQKLLRREPNSGGYERLRACHEHHLPEKGMVTPVTLGGGKS